MKGERRAATCARKGEAKEPEEAGGYGRDGDDGHGCWWPCQVAEQHCNRKERPFEDMYFHITGVKLE